jgi:multicomponent Na+:H+ antiporter subunit D
MPPFGTFLGEHAIESAAIDRGNGWTTIIFFLAGTLTAAAVFRVAGHVFLGLGPEEDHSTEGASSIREARETHGGGRSHVPATMFVTGLVLVIFAVGVGLIPPLHEEVRAAAYTMTDHAAYAARVLDGSHIPDVQPPRHSTPESGSLARGFGATAAALLLAAFTLSPKWDRRKQLAYMYPLRAPLNALRAIHTGHVGDYVAFLTFGVAVVGVALGLLIHLFGL